MTLLHTQRAAVRVIKRQQRDLQTQSPSDSSSGAKESCTNRALAATVSSWIAEFRQRQQSETAALFNNLFKEGPPPVFGAAVVAG